MNIWMEFVLISGFISIGTVLLITALYSVYKTSLVTKLYIMLIPAIFVLCLVGFYVGRNGIEHWPTLITAFSIGLGTLLLNLVGLANYLRTQIRDEVIQIKHRQNEVQKASEQLAQNSTVLAQGAEQQSQSVNQTNSQVSDLNKQTESAQEYSDQAAQLMLEAHQLTEEGHYRMNQLQKTIKENNEATAESNKIIKSIDEIAFQTNLLALNAAVEAARAGEAGQGFAVVAEEVRHLALRAAEAAKETSEVLESTQQKSNHSVHTAEKVVQQFEDIRTKSETMTSLLKNLSEITDEQMSGFQQIETTVVKLESISHQNAASAEQTSTSSHQLQKNTDSVEKHTAVLLQLIDGGQGETFGSLVKHLATWYQHR
ncbi:MAG: methyl-accepting chemotaxis protein [Bacteroidota bacterium]